MIKWQKKSRVIVSVFYFIVKKAKEKQPPDFPIFAAANNIRMGLLYAML